MENTWPLCKFIYMGYGNFVFWRQFTEDTYGPVPDGKKIN